MESRWKDPLKYRLQRMVQFTLEAENDRNFLWGLDFIADKQRHILAKVVWVIILSTCLVLFSYQTYDRFTYYKSYPVSVDVIITERNLQTFPHLTVCYPETPKIFKVFENVKRRCGNLHVRQGLNVEEVLVEELWTASNTSEAVVSAQAISDGNVNLESRNVLMQFGICTTYWSKSNKPLKTDRGRFEITIGKYEGKCMGRTNIHLNIHDDGDNAWSQMDFIGRVGSLIDIRVSMKEFQYVNRTGRPSPCISAEAFRKCQDECFRKALIDRGLQCSLPHFPPIENITSCQNKKTRRNAWEISSDYLSGTKAGKPCSCTRKCHHRTFSPKFTEAGDFKNQTVIRVAYDDFHETFINEQLNYDIISFLNDIGGNSGLYIGFSLLSFFQLIRILTRNKKADNSIFSQEDPLFKKVTRMCSKWKQMPQTVNFSNYRNKLHHSHSAAVAACVLVWSYTMFNRVSHYMEFPARLAVNVEFNTTLDTTTFVACSKIPEVVSLQKKLASGRNLSNYCDIPLYDLLDLPGINASVIWNHKKDKRYSWHESRPIVLYEGTCSDFYEADKQLPTFRITWVYVKPNKTQVACDPDNHKVYLVPPSGRIDFFLYTYYTENYQEQKTYYVKEIRRDATLEKCVSDEDNEQCKEECRKKKLFANLKYRLPYMPNSSLPLCTESRSAKHAHLRYIELYVLPSISTQDCGCLPKCVTRFYDTRTTVRQRNTSSFCVSAATNVVESFSKVPSYPLVKLLCDVGGLMGSIMGLCLFTVMEQILNGVSFCKMKQNKK